MAPSFSSYSRCSCFQPEYQSSTAAVTSQALASPPWKIIPCLLSFLLIRPKAIYQADWLADFTHMPCTRHHRYPLTFLDTFSGWLEAIPTTSMRPLPLFTLSYTSLTPALASLPPFTAILGYFYFPGYPTGFCLPWHFQVPLHSISHPRLRQNWRSLPTQP